MSRRKHRGRRLAAAGAFLALLAGCRWDLNLTAPGESGDFLTYGARLKVVDATTGRALPDVNILVKDGPRSVVAKLTTNEMGRASFLKSYELRLLRHYGHNVGYPDNFLLSCTLEGHKTLNLTVPRDKFLLDAHSGKGAPRHLIRLEPGRGVIEKRL